MSFLPLTHILKGVPADPRKVGECPNCGVYVVIAAQPEQARRRVRAQVDLKADADSDWTLQPMLLPDQETLAYAVWDQGEVLPVGKIAKIIGLHRNDVARRAAEGEFPGAYKSADTSHAPWIITRGAITEFLDRPRKPGRGGAFLAKKTTDKRLKPKPAKPAAAKARAAQEGGMTPSIRRALNGAPFDSGQGTA